MIKSQFWLPTLSLTILGVVANQAQAACSPNLSGSNGEATLQQSFDGLLGPGVLSANNCASPDSQWTSTGPTAATVLFELAGYANSNEFGIYDPTAPGTKVLVFNGPAGPGAQQTIGFTPSGPGYSVSINGNSQATFSSAVIGFYMRVVATGDTYYSETTLNSDAIDHMLAYQGTNSNFISGPGSVPGSLFGSNDYILGWEDLPNGGDLDYQDLAVLVRNITPVPIPAAFWLLASGLVGLAGIGRSRRGIA
jgi:hypothetical protein